MFLVLKVEQQTALSRAVWIRLQPIRSQQDQWLSRSARATEDPKAFLSVFLADRAFGPPHPPTIGTGAGGPFSLARYFSGSRVFHVKLARLTTETETLRLKLGFETGMMADQFGPHARKHGPRLDQIQSLKRRELFCERAAEGGDADAGAAQIALSADVGERERGSASSARLWPLGLGGKPSVSPDLSAGQAQARAPGVKKGKVGRPKAEGVRPWEAAGMKRATWFRRKKEGGG